MGVVEYFKMDRLNIYCQHLNNFHSPIKFTYETESGNKLSLQLMRTGDNIENCVFRKPTSTDIYIN